MGPSGAPLGWYRRAMISLLPLATCDQTTMKLPCASRATAGSYWSGVTSLLARKSGDAGMPVLVNIRPLTPFGSVVPPPFQTTRKAPEAAPATAGACSTHVAQELTLNAAPCAVGPPQAETAKPNARAPPQKATAFPIEISFLCPVGDTSLFYYGATGPAV